MYRNIIIPGIICAVSFVLMLGTCIVGNLLPPRVSMAIKVTILSSILASLLIFAFSLVPVMIWVVLRGTISVNSYLKGAWHLADSDFRVKMLKILAENEVRIFYGLLVFLWGILAIGLAIAIPVMIKKGVFKELLALLE